MHDFPILEHLGRILTSIRKNGANEAETRFAQNKTSKGTWKKNPKA